MIPRRKTPKPNQKEPVNQTINSSIPQDNANMPSIVEILQNQIAEERKNARAKSQKNKPINSAQNRPILQKKKPVVHEPREPQEPKHRIQQPPAPSEMSAKETTTAISRAETKVMMQSEGVGDDQPNQLNPKLEPTGFTYFDRLNEKDIFLDPLTYF